MSEPDQPMTPTTPSRGSTGSTAMTASTGSTPSTPPTTGVKQHMTPDPHGESDGEAEEHESHGHSTAAWTGVGVIILGSLVMAVAVAFATPVWFVVGAVIVVLGAVAGKVLAMAGYGAKASTTAAAQAPGAQRADMPGRSQHDSGTQ
jgi:nucleoside recognition membrane protein YjiH